jgi:hypothetical protein
MTILELREKYSVEETCADSSDDDTLKYEIFSPFFRNLYENKIVYYDKFLCLALVQDIQITPRYLKLMVAPLLKVEGHEFRMRQCPKEPWSFGSRWCGFGIVNSSFHAPYAPWRVWPESDIVKRVENCLLNQDYQGAIDLTLNDYKTI